jgi:hypothetical protein
MVILIDGELADGLDRDQLERARRAALARTPSRSWPGPARWLAAQASAGSVTEVRTSTTVS